MAIQTIDISESSHRVLLDLAAHTGQTPREVIDKALDTYRRQVFIEQVNAGYAALRADAKAWAEVEEERRSMSGCLMDGLDAKETWGEDRRPVPPEEGKPNG